jgi:hypothetical protein
LGAFRIQAALKQLGIEVSLRTCSRLLALNRALYALSRVDIFDEQCRTVKDFACGPTCCYDMW